METPSSKKCGVRKFGFAGMCFGVGFICWAIQKGDAALNPSLSWTTGLGWYSAATLLLVAGIWLWNQTANRHWIARTVLTVVALVGMILLCYGPVIQQYRREHLIQAKASEQAVTPPPTPRPAEKQADPTAAAKKTSGNPRPRKIAIASSKQKATALEPSGGPLAPTGVPSVGSINQGPCGVLQIGGSGNQATGGNCDVPPPKIAQIGSGTDNEFDGTNYVTSRDYNIDSKIAIGRLTITVSVSSLVGVHFGPQRTGFFVAEMTPVVNGSATIRMDNVFGQYRLIVYTRNKESSFEAAFACEPVQCVTETLRGK